MILKDNFTSKRPVEIGIFEMRRHIPILYTFSKICKTNNTNVTIFTTKELFSRLKSYMGEKNRKNYSQLFTPQNCSHPYCLEKQGVR